MAVVFRPKVPGKMATDHQPDLLGSPQAADSGGRLDLAVPESLRPYLRLGTVRTDTVARTEDTT